MLHVKGFQVVDVWYQAPSQVLLLLAYILEEHIILGCLLLTMLVPVLLA